MGCAGLGLDREPQSDILNLQRNPSDFTLERCRSAWSAVQFVGSSAIPAFWRRVESNHARVREGWIRVEADA